MNFNLVRQQTGHVIRHGSSLETQVRVHSVSAGETAVSTTLKRHATFEGVTAKYEQLKTLLSSYGSCLVAYSGGVDSVFLAVIAHKVLGARALAVIADSPSLPRRELKEALEIAERFEFPVR